MHVLFKCQVFRNSESHLGSDQTLYNRVVRKIQEHCHMVRNAAFLKGITEEIRHIMFDAHGSEHDGKLFIGSLTK